MLKEFAESFDRPGMEAERPYKCDFRKLRDKALAAFGTEADILQPVSVDQLANKPTN